VNAQVVCAAVLAAVAIVGLVVLMSSAWGMI
jgi:hypothetical protein